MQLSSLLSIGSKSVKDQMLLNRLGITNFIALSGIVVCIVYTFLCLQYLPTLIFIPLLSILGFAIILIFNAIGFINFSRVSVSLHTVTSIHLFNSFLAPSSDDIIAGMYFLEACIIVIPYIIYTKKELRWMIANLVINLLIFSSLDFTTDLINIKMIDTTKIDFHVVSRIELISGLIFILGIFTFQSVEIWNLQQNKVKGKQKAAGLKDKIAVAEQEIEELTNKLSSQEQHQKETSWQVKMLADFAEIIRTELDLENLYDSTVSSLAYKLDLNQVGLYVISGESGNEELKRAACFAYDRKKFQETEVIALGEGLVGQCYLEEKTLLLDNLPDGFLNITSGLGSATANFLAIIPMKVHGETKGVIEVASFRKLHSFEIDFIEKVGESLSFAISSRIANIETRRLLETSQEQSKALRTQEEEMRQNLEEMEVIQNGMERREKEYIARINELEKKLVESENKVIRMINK